MEIRKLFERNNEAAAQTVKNSQQVSAYKQAAEQGTRSSSSDSITISALSRQLSQISEILAEDEKGRQSRVAELRAKIEDGDYSVDVRGVAEAVISFAADGEGARAA